MCPTKSFHVKAAGKNPIWFIKWPNPNQMTKLRYYCSCWLEPKDKQLLHCAYVLDLISCTRKIEDQKNATYGFVIGILFIHATRKDISANNHAYKNMADTQFYGNLVKCTHRQIQNNGVIFRIFSHLEQTAWDRRLTERKSEKEREREREREREEKERDRDREIQKE